MGKLKKIYIFLIVFVSIQIMNLLLNKISSHLYDLFSTNNSVKSVVIATISELIQLSLAIFIFKIVYRENISKLGINLKNIKLSLKIFFLFTIIWILLTFTFLIATYIFNKSLWYNYLHTPLPSKEYILAYLGFAAIFPGIGEETLFRGLLIFIFLRAGFKGSIKIKKINISYVAILTAIIFTFAHVYYKIYPFEILHINYIQLLMAFSCGIYYAVVYEKTESLLCTILSHNYANLITSLLGYALSILGSGIVN